MWFRLHDSDPRKLARSSAALDQFEELDKALWHQGEFHDDETAILFTFRRRRGQCSVLMITSTNDRSLADSQMKVQRIKL